jgi:co-chaperonin GroES (HSP10)
MKKTSTALAKVDRSPLAPVRQLTKDDLTDRSIPAILRAQVLRHPQAMEVVDVLRKMCGRPLGAKVLIYPLPQDTRFGQIHLPDNAKEDQAVGIVVGVGEGYLEGGKYIPLSVFEGNYVHFSKYVNQRIDVFSEDGTKYELFQIHVEEISFVVGGRPPGSTNGDQAKI